MAYVEDLAGEQARRGHDVTYFFSGRQYPVRRRPHLRRWDHDGVRMIELVNSPLYDHGRQPELELEEPVAEELFARVLEEARPDVLHVHELAGLPSSLLDAAGVPVVVTLQDYFPLCPAFKLLDAGGRVCLRREVGDDCVATTTADPRSPGLLVEATVGFHLRRPVWRRGGRTTRWDPLIDRVARAVAARTSPPRPADAAAFQRRRDVNVERLNRADRVIAMSHRVAEIYTQLGVDPARVQTLQLTLAHLERLRPRTAEVGAPLTFATLAALESVPKGGQLLLDAARRLPPGRFRLLVYGAVDPRFAAAAAALPGVELRGLYGAPDLDAMLDEVDVGLVPSLWEEAYGYVGMEFLAKGIPVIANAIGGMPDYTRPGETGWLNRSCSARELAGLMNRLIEQPDEVAGLTARVRAGRAGIVKTLADHGDEMDELYGELIGARAPS